VCVGPSALFELTAVASGGHIDAGRRQSLEVLVTSLGVDGVHGLFSAFEAVLDEGKQHSIFIIAAVEKRADMTWRAKY